MDGMVEDASQLELKKFYYLCKECRMSMDDIELANKHKEKTSHDFLKVKKESYESLMFRRIPSTSPPERPGYVRDQRKEKQARRNL